MRKLITVIMISVTILLESAGIVQARDKDTRILGYDQTEMQENCIEVGIEGDYNAQADVALKHMNEIRLEACQQGVPMPGNPSEKLTMEDYKPLQWSNALEYVARIRAAEASVIPEHVRPNGTSCFSVIAPNYVRDSAENLAWNFSRNMVNAINQWYKEKQDWVNQKEGAVTGHYTSMINPRYTYVGLGNFYSFQGYYPGTTCGRFARGSDYDSTAMAEENNVIQKMHILKSALQNVRIECDYEISGTTENMLAIGDKRQYSLRASTRYQSGGESVMLLGNQKWTSSNPSVISVSGDGVVTAKKSGTAMVTATTGDFTASTTISVLSMKKTKVTSIKAGKRKLTIHWKKISQNTTGYQIRYSTNKKFVKEKTKQIKGYKKTKVALTKLKKKKKYYVQVRTYYKFQDEEYYSEWSAVKCKKTK